jgi:hypothetical protein
MTPEPRCARFRRLISMQLDEHLTPDDAQELDRHLGECAACRAFEASQHALRRTLRLAPVAQTPDVTDAVMLRITREPNRQVWEARWRLTAIAGVAAALVVLATSFPVLERTPQIAQAADVTRLAFAAAGELDTYRATFEIVERGWHPDIEERRFRADVWYRAPEKFRLEVRDRTRYPTGSWPRNDIDVVSSPTRSWIRQPYACPTQALPGCAIQAGVEERTIVRRQPFDGTSLVPTDIVVPLETLAASDALNVVGNERIEGRASLHVQLSYRQAFPLVDALRPGGSWVPLLPLDRVDVWLDRESWFPLRYTVSRPPQEHPFLEVSATDFRRPGAIDERFFDAPRRGIVRSGGFVRRELPEGLRRLLPQYTAGLRPYRRGRNGAGQSVVSFTDGLSFLKITFDRMGSRPDIDEPAEVVRVGESSLGYYRPAAPRLPRRIDLFGRGRHARIESNLRREQLARVAGSMSLRGRAPRVTRSGGLLVRRLTRSQLEDADVGTAHDVLPDGYRAMGGWSSSGAGGRELAIVFLPSQTALEGSEIRLFRSTRVHQLPPTSEDMVGVDVEGSAARWSRERGELEWIDAAGIYRAITAPSLDLPSVVHIAREIESA